MKLWKRLAALLLSGAMALSLFACTAGDSTESPSPGPSTSPDPAASAGPSASPAVDVDLTQDVLQFAAGLSSDDVLLTLNGTDIHADLFLYMLAVNCARNQVYLSYYGKTLADVASELLQDAVYMTNYHTVIRQKAAELGCLPTDAQAEEIAKAVEDSGPEDAVLYWGLTPESAEFITATSTYYGNVLAAVTHEPTEEELNQYIAGQGIFSVKRILLKTVDDANQPLEDSVIAEKKTQAGDLLAQLQGAEDLPAKFDELMNEHSEDGRTEDGALAAPDGYVFDSTDNLVGGFREAALELEPGQLSGIVETDYGYHIMLRLALTDEQLEEHREACRQDAFNSLVSQWLEEAETSQSDALTALDVADFYSRLTAYQNALSAQRPAESAPVESGGVG